MAQRPWLSGTFTVMMMNSLEPATFHDGGMPQIFQTGETFEGRPLVDHQHPARPVHEPVRHLAAPDRDRRRRGVGAGGAGRRARARPHRVHASRVVGGEPGGAPRPPLAGLVAHHALRDHRRRRVAPFRARRRPPSTARSPTRHAGTSTAARRTRSPRGSRCGLGARLVGPGLARVPEESGDPHRRRRAPHHRVAALRRRRRPAASRRARSGARTARSTASRTRCWPRRPGRSPPATSSTGAPSTSRRNRSCCINKGVSEREQHGHEHGFAAVARPTVPIGALTVGYLRNMDLVGSLNVGLGGGHHRLPVRRVAARGLRGHAGLDARVPAAAVGTSARRPAPAPPLRTQLCRARRCSSSCSFSCTNNSVGTSVVQGAGWTRYTSPSWSTMWISPSASTPNELMLPIPRPSAAVQSRWSSGLAVHQAEASGSSPLQ